MNKKTEDENTKLDRPVRYGIWAIMRSKRGREYSGWYEQRHRPVLFETEDEASSFAKVMNKQDLDQAKFLFTFSARPYGS